MVAIFTSAGLTSPDSTLKSGTRISSGHIIVCSTITSSRTRSTAIDVRWRSATVTTAIRSASTQRLAQQRVRLGAGLLRLEVVALLEQHRVDLVARHELLDRDLARRRRGQLGQVVVGEDDHLAVLGLVALGDVGVRDLLAVDRADALVLDPPAVLGVHLPERHVVGLGGGVELHGHADQPEGDRALPDRTHADQYCLSRANTPPKLRCAEPPARGRMACACAPMLADPQAPTCPCRATAGRTR